MASLPELAASALTNTGALTEWADEVKAKTEELNELLRNPPKLILQIDLVPVPAERYDPIWDSYNACSVPVGSETCLLPMGHSLQGHDARPDLRTVKEELGLLPRRKHKKGRN